MELNPLPVDEDVVEVELQEAHYDIPGRSVRMTVDVTNGASKPGKTGRIRNGIHSLAECGCRS